MTQAAGEYQLFVTELFNMDEPAGSVNNDHIQGIYNWRSAYDNANTYYKNDVVSYNGRQYIRTNNTPGNELPTTSNWDSLPGTIGSERDLQSVTLTNQVTVSGSYMDLDGITLTTNDLGGTGTYKVVFGSIADTTGNNQSLFFKLQQNGVDVPNQMVELNQYGNERSTAIISCVVSNVSAGDIFKIQWRRGSNGNGRCYYRTLVIDGVLSTSVV